MRLYDKVLTQAPQMIRAGMLAAAEHTTVVNADSVAAYYALSSQMEWEPKDYPFVRSPWEAAFIEWNAPEAYRTRTGWEKLPKMQMGVFVLPTPLDATRRDLVSYLSHTLPPNEDWKQVKADIDDSTIRIDVRQFIYGNGRLGCPPISGTWCTDDSGALKWHGIYGSNESVELGLLEAIGGPDAVLGYWHIAWLAISFCHAKGNGNVRLVDTTEADQPLPKIRRRLKLPDVRSVTVDIGFPAARMLREEYSQGDASPMAKHVVRGHFCEYTAERPMFGNPKLVGRFWHPPHAKGKRENGEIVKSYRLDMPHEGGQPHEPAQATPPGLLGTSSAT